MKEYLSYFLPFVFVAPLFKLTHLEKNRGGMFLKKLWCCVGGVRGEGGVGIPR